MFKYSGAQTLISILHSSETETYSGLASTVNSVLIDKLTGYCKFLFVKSSKSESDTPTSERAIGTHVAPAVSSIKSSAILFILNGKVLFTEIPIVPDSMVRLSIGLEDVEDLIEDIENSLNLINR